MANKNFFVRNGLTVNNFTTISGTDGTIAVGNAVITSTTLTVGNSVTNSTTISTTNIRASNVVATTTANGAIACYGYSNSGYGVQGVSNSGAGVIGMSTINAGVYGFSNNYFGVYGRSDTGYGGYFLSSNNYGAVITSYSGSPLLVGNLSNTFFSITNTGTAVISVGITLPDGNTINGVANSSYYYSNTLNKAVTVDGLWSSAALVTLTDGATITPDLSTGANFVVTLGGNRTVAAPTNAKPGQCGIILVKQDATGSRTLAWNAAWKWPGGTAPTLTTTASAVDKIFYLVETSSIIHASAELNSK